MIQTFEALDGAILIDKPSGPTSHDIVDAVRRHFNIAKVGHCGTLDPSAIQQGLMLVGEAAQQYLQLYNDYVRRLPPPPAEEEPALEVSSVLYGLMSEKQRLAELAKLVGQLRYAVEGGDTRLVGETVREMKALGQHLPEKYRVDELIAAAQIPGPRGARLSQLYIDRSYRLSEEDYGSLQAIEEEIRSLQQ